MIITSLWQSEFMTKLWQPYDDRNIFSKSGSTYTQILLQQLTQGKQGAILITFWSYNSAERNYICNYKTSQSDILKFEVDTKLNIICLSTTNAWRFVPWICVQTKTTKKFFLCHRQHSAQTLVTQKFTKFQQDQKQWIFTYNIYIQ